MPDTIILRCEAKGLRMTGQRRVIAHVLEDNADHPDVEELYARANEMDPNISLATVYRTLRLLTTMDLLRQLELPEGGKRFELATDDDHDHHHLICVACGRTEEFESEAVLEAGADAAERFGFKLLSSRLTVRGLCPSCAAIQGGDQG